MRKKYLKNISEKDWRNYAKQRNLCSSLLRKANESSYLTLNEKIVIDNRKSWKTVKPMQSNKLVSSEKITIVE